MNLSAVLSGSKIPIEDIYSNGWMVGKMKMKDWKSACVTWKTRQQERNQAAPAGMVKVFPRGSQRPIVITKEEYDRSVQSGTNYYKLIQ